MRNSFKKRIINALFLGILIFVTLCNLFGSKGEAKYFFLILSILCAAGSFISETLTTMNESIWKIISIELLIIFLEFIILAFVFGIVYDITHWFRMAFIFTIPFALSIIVSNKFRD